MSISGFRLLGQGIWPTLKKDQGRLFPGADRPGQARLCRAMAVGLKTSGHEAQGPWAHGSFITHETRGNASAKEIFTVESKEEETRANAGLASLNLPLSSSGLSVYPH